METHSSLDAATTLCAQKGIGPWTAAAILSRGLGRLDVFPENDSGVAKVCWRSPVASSMSHALAALAPEQGMLYYHFLLARLEARGDINRVAATRQA